MAIAKTASGSAYFCDMCETWNLRPHLVLTLVSGCVYYRALVHFEHLLSVLRALRLKNQNNSVH